MRASPPDQDRTIAEKVMAPFRNFPSIEAAGVLVLVACAVLAVAWANSIWQELYPTLWDETYLSVGLAGPAGGSRKGSGTPLSDG
jgi:hypothetical protein